LNPNNKLDKYSINNLKKKKNETNVLQIKKAISAGTEMAGLKKIVHL